MIFVLFVIHDNQLLYHDDDFIFVCVYVAIIFFEIIIIVVVSDVNPNAFIYLLSC